MKSYTWVIVALVLVLICISPASAWYGSYTYVQTHVLQGFSNWSDNTSVVVPFDVYSGAGASVGNRVYLNSHSLSFPNDVMFTDASDTPLARQIINISNATTGSYANIYVNVSSIAKTGNTTIKIYYGSVGAADPDNGDRTFLTWENGTFPSPYPFAKYAGNPLIATGAIQPSIIHNASSGGYWMYINEPAANGPIDLYTSANEMTGFSYNSQSLASGYYCDVTFSQSDGYRMVFSNSSALVTINLSTSNSGSGFTNQGVAINLGSSGQWDSQYIYDPSEMKIGSTYYLYYAGRNVTTANYGYVGLATSSTGLPGSYTKQGIVLSTGGVGAFDSNMVVDPSVMQYSAGNYIMFYTGYDGSIQRWGYATSTDGVTWVKSTSNPIEWFTNPTYESTIGGNEPDFLIENGKYKVYYRSNTTANSISYLNFTQDASGLPWVAHKPWGIGPNNGTWVSGGGVVSQIDASATNHNIRASASTTNMVVVSQMSHTGTTRNNEVQARYDGSKYYAIGPEGVPANVYLTKHNPGFNNLNNTASDQAQNTYYNYKLTTWLANISAKKWDADSMEPTLALLTASDTEISTGSPGLYSYGGGLNVHKFFAYKAILPEPVHSDYTGESGTVVVPIVSFITNVSSGSAPLAVQFNDTSITAITGNNWSFTNISATGGNGTQVWWSQLRNTTQTFGVGNWSITQNTTNASGFNISSVPYYINVSASILAPPAATFTTNDTTGSAPLAVQFTDTSTNTPTSWDWGWGDGTANGSTQNPIHTYTTTNNFTVFFNASNAAGYSTNTTNITVGFKPVASFTNDNVPLNPAPQTVHFTDTSTNTPSAWVWSWGDGTPDGTTQNTAHTYTTNGTFVTRLYASNALGNSSAATGLIGIGQSLTPTPTSTAVGTKGEWTNIKSQPVGMFGTGTTLVALLVAIVIFSLMVYVLTTNNLTGSIILDVVVAVMIGVVVFVICVVIMPIIGGVIAGI